MITPSSRDEARQSPRGRSRKKVGHRRPAHFWPLVVVGLAAGLGIIVLPVYLVAEIMGEGWAAALAFVAFLVIAGALLSPWFWVEASAYLIGGAVAVGRRVSDAARSG